MRSVFNRSSRPVVRPAFVGQPESREDLLLWAAQHNYPTLRFTGVKAVRLHPVQGLPPAIQPMKYAVGMEGCKDNKTLWEIAVHQGKDDMIDGLLMHIKSLSKEQLEFMKNSKRK
jgi:hypothetical protein